MELRILSGSELLDWRRKQLFFGGRAEDLDWLLDLAGGLCWSEFQKIFLDPSKMVKLEKSLEDLEDFWRLHLEKQIPLQYLVGRCPWRDFELEISSNVLIPRQETELLIDLAMEKIHPLNHGLWVDLGTGSGPLAVALARALPGWKGYVVDCSQECLLMAQKNLNRLAPKGSFSFNLGNWWEPLKPWWGSIYLAVSNPPYIPSILLDSLDPVVRDNEPYLALCGGHDGLVHIRSVIEGAVLGLRNDGWLLLEHHHDQSDAVIELMRKNGLEDVTSEFDLNGIKRFAIGRAPKKID